MAYNFFGFDDAVVHDVLGRQALRSVMPRANQAGLLNIVLRGSHFGAYANRSRRFMSFFDVVAHGNEEIIAEGVRTGRVYTPAQFLPRLLNTPGFNRGSALNLPQAIRLVACNTGTDLQGFAQQLANSLGTIGLAPRSYVYAFG